MPAWKQRARLCRGVFYELVALCVQAGLKLYLHLTTSSVSPSADSGISRDIPCSHAPNE